MRKVNPYDDDTREVVPKVEDAADLELEVDPYTHEIISRSSDDEEDNDRLPATQLAREGFFTQNPRIHSQLLQEQRRLEQLEALKEKEERALRKRMLQEQMLLREFDGFRIQHIDDPSRVGVVGNIRTNSGNMYTLWIPLGKFPYEAPRMYIVHPRGLRDHAGSLIGERLTENRAHRMHLLESERGSPQICHYNDRFWSPNVTLLKIVLKGRLWLEAYEQHLRGGNDINKYLPHMG